MGTHVKHNYDYDIVVNWPYRIFYHSEKNRTTLENDWTDTLEK